MPKRDLPVTACLLSWKRPNNMQLIVDSLHGLSFIDEILIWNNNPGVDLPVRGSKVRVLHSPENMMCYGRFLCAREAKNDVIYVQDDDVVVADIPSLYRKFLASPERLIHGLSPHHYRSRDRITYPNGSVAMLGWGAIFQKEWLHGLDPFVEAYEGDPLFRREADKFFTLSLAQHPTTILARFRQLWGAKNPAVALYKEKGHRMLSALAIRKALATLRESKPIRYPVTWNVVITSHNYGQYLAEAVDSVLRNDADYVVTIVDDASTDNTLEVCEQFARKYSHVSYIRHDSNGGAARARNSGIAAVDSVFVVLLDADDRLGPDYLFSAERLLISGCDVANPDAILFGNRRARWSAPDATSLQMLTQRNSVHYCAAFRRSYWAQVGGINEEMENWEDYDFWLRLAEAGARIRAVRGDHFYYRRHGQSRSTISAGERAQLEAQIRDNHRDVFGRSGT